MKVKRQLAMLMAAMMALGTPMTMFAQEIDASGGTGSGSADTNFSVDAETLGGGLVVLIPDEIVLEYNEDSAVFEKTAQVTAKGFVEVDKYLEVSTPTDVTYALENFNAVTADGTVTFGSTIDDNQVENWTQTELKTKDGDTVVGVSKDIYVAVPESNVLDIGTYRSVLSFSIELLDGSVDSGSDSSEELTARGYTYRVVDASSRQIAITGLAEGNSVDGGSLSIPSNLDLDDGAYDVVQIDAYAFCENDDITSVTIPTTVTSIGDYAFANCSNLATVTYNEQDYTTLMSFDMDVMGAITLGSRPFAGSLFDIASPDVDYNPN